MTGVWQLQSTMVLSWRATRMTLPCCLLRRSTQPTAGNCASERLLAASLRCSLLGAPESPAHLGCRAVRAMVSTPFLALWHSSDKISCADGRCFCSLYKAPSVQCIFLFCSQHGSLRVCCALSRKIKQAAIEGRRICKKTEFLAMSALKDACLGEACYHIMGQD